MQFPFTPRQTANGAEESMGHRTEEEETELSVEWLYSSGIIEWQIELWCKWRHLQLTPTLCNLHSTSTHRVCRLEALEESHRRHPMEDWYKLRKCVKSGSESIYEWVNSIFLFRVIFCRTLDNLRRSQGIHCKGSRTIYISWPAYIIYEWAGVVVQSKG